MEGEHMNMTILLFVFLATASIDALYALYTIHVTERKALPAALSGTLIHFLTAFTVISYTKNYFNLIPLLLGSFVGTFLTVRCFKRRI
jgi:hypothetical protein